MAIFIISAIDVIVPPSLKVTIEENIPEDDRVELNSMSWLISFEGTTLQLSAKLVIPNVGLAKALVAHAESIAGYGPLPILKWIKAHGGDSYCKDCRPSAPTPATPTPVAPASTTPTPQATTSAAPAPVAPAPQTPTPAAPAPQAPTPAAPSASTSNPPSST